MNPYTKYLLTREWPNEEGPGGADYLRMNQIYALKSVVESLMTENEALTSRVFCLEGTIGALKSVVESLMTENEALTSRVVCLEGTIGALKSESVELQTQVRLIVSLMDHRKGEAQ
jgi:regulator of replication initiation timing